MSQARVCVTNQSRTLLICVVKPSSCSCGVHAPPGGTVKPQNDGGMAKSSAAMAAMRGGAPPTDDRKGALPVELPPPSHQEGSPPTIKSFINCDPLIRRSFFEEISADQGSTPCRVIF